MLNLNNKLILWVVRLKELGENRVKSRKCAMQFSALYIESEVARCEEVSVGYDFPFSSSPVSDVNELSTMLDSDSPYFLEDGRRKSRFVQTLKIERAACSVARRVRFVSYRDTLVIRIASRLY